MRSRNTNLRAAICSRVLNSTVAVAAFALLTTMPLAQAARNPNPGVVPPQATAYGHSYGEWGAMWWQWALGLPPDINPVLDPTGEFCDSGQQGQVWFLAGTFGGPAERVCEVPSGKAIFFPIVNWTLWEPDDHEAAVAVAESLGIDPSQLTDAELMQLGVAWLTDQSTPLSCTVDGVPLSDLNSYRGTPTAYDLVMDDQLAELFGIEGGLKSPAAADGYWLMLKPLPPGEHTIEWHGAANIGDPLPTSFTVDIIYHLKVVPGDEH